jgi:type III secretion system IpaD/SipD/SspD family effector
MVHMAEAAQAPQAAQAAQGAQGPYPSGAGKSSAATPPAGQPTGIKSDAELWKILAGTIGETQAGTVDVHHRMLTTYTAFYRDVVEFRARLRTAISAGSDQNHIGVDVGRINYELKALRQKWFNATLFGPGTLKQAQRWSAEWGLPINGYATANDVRVVIDTSPIDAMIEATGKVNKTYGEYALTVAPDHASQKTDWLAAEHHAWDTAMGEQHRQIETKVNTLAEQYNHALSTFNNLNKTLSASTNAMFESLVAYLRAL